MHHPAIHDARRPVDSFWEADAGQEVAGADPLDTDAACEVAIVGGGYAGLSAALHLARDHGIDARVLEAGGPGWGASGRNGGFACRGSAKLSMPAIARRFGAEAARDFHRAQCAAIDLVADLARREGIDVAASSPGEIVVAHRPGRMAELDAERRFQAEILGQASELWSRAELAERAFAGPEAHGALFTPVGFGIHPLRYALGLARAAIRHGARVHCHSRVVGWRTEGGRHRLITERGSLSAARVIVATAGFTEDGLHPAFAGTLLPVLSNIVTTRPLDAGERAAQGWRTDLMASDTRDLLFYFRMLPDGRFLFGARGGLDSSPASVAPMRAWLERRLGRMFPAWAGIETTHFWRGLTDITRDLLPHVGATAGVPGVFHALGWHGNGVAMATWAGRHLAREIAGALGPGEAAPRVMGLPLRRFPLPALRGLYARAAYAAYGLRDRIG